MEKRPATSALQDLLLENSSPCLPKKRRLNESSCHGLVDFPFIEWDFDEHGVSREHMDLFRSLPAPTLYSSLVRSLPFKSELSSAALMNHPALVASAYYLHKNSTSNDTASTLHHLLQDQLEISAK